MLKELNLLGSKEKCIGLKLLEPNPPMAWTIGLWENMIYWDGLMQDCSNSIAKALELLQSCTKPSIYHMSIQQQCQKAFKITGNIYTKLQAMYPNIFKGELVII